MYIENLEEIDLFIAYKKAKFELFNDKNTIATIDLLQYEKELESNIQKLYKDIKKNGLKNINCPDYYEIPKSLTFVDDRKIENQLIAKVHFYSSSIEHHKLTDEKNSNIELKFRKVINAEINFHIVSALWIDKVGQHIDSKFGNDIYGSRLVRIKPIETSSCEHDVSNQKYNMDSPRIFESYQHKYQSWRNNSFKSIRELHKISSAVAITMDITSFYHTIKLDEFITNDFYQEFELDILFQETPSLKKFHNDFIDKLRDWNISISMDDKTSDGVPIGLSASPILANAVMRDFDKRISKNLAPTYYGRYVDDILLVFPDNGNMSNGEDIINYLLSKGVVDEEETSDGKDLCYNYFKLKKSKQKIFYLDKDADLSIIDGIEAEINSVSSEWRFMPDVGNDKSSLLEKIIGFYADGEEFNDALRKIDATTIKRLGLSLLISHSHSLNQYVHPKEWKVQRNKIYDLIENHIFIPQNFFSNFGFISKVFQLMIHSEDGERAYCFLEKVLIQINELKKIDSSKYIQSNGNQIEFFKFEEYSFYILQEIFFKSFNTLNKMSKKYSKKIIDLLFNTSPLYEKTSIKLANYYNERKTEETKKIEFNFDNLHIPKYHVDVDIIKEINSYLFLADLSFDGYATSSTEYILTKNEKSLFNTITNKYVYGSDFNMSLYANEENHIEFINHFNSCLSNLESSNIPLVFPSRLFSAADISIVASLTEFSHLLFKYYVNFLRGNHSALNDLDDDSNKEEVSPPIVEIENKCLKRAKKINIAITNFHVRDDYWKQSVIQRPVKTIERYNQISQIIKEAVKKRPNYLVLPELSIPQEWAWLISKKLLANNISLITGVEYIHVKKEKIVHNSIMKFLVADDIGFNYMKFYRQDKAEGAYAEKIELKNIANIELKPDKYNKQKYIYKHGNFYFSSLICNELTDINNRMMFRGKIDALFAVEWNRDIKSFNSLVESASLDIHSYVIQVNNRKYGDSRIRAPFSEDYKRDIVQVRGGKYDYLIVGEIDIEKLRDFQSHNISPEYPFKPTPTGFKMSEERREWENDK